MRTLLAIIVLAALAAPVLATGPDLGRHAPVKPAQPVAPIESRPPVPLPGDTVADPFVIPNLPYYGSGTTAGFTDDYDEACPYSGSSSPDVVYVFTTAGDIYATFDLCGSAYDTKIYIYDQDLHDVACNDDFYYDADCGYYVSKLELVPLSGQQTYYVVVDGYGGQYGDFQLSITTNDLPCNLECPPEGWAEGEPPLHDGYVDTWNGGCSSPDLDFQALFGDESGELVLCGVSGWYLANGNEYRDTDWFDMFPGETGTIDITIDAEAATYAMEIAPADCNLVDPVQWVVAGPCSQASLSLSGYSFGQHVWFWVAPTTFSPSVPGNEYDYVLWISGLELPIATQRATWGSVKALYE